MGDEVRLRDVEEADLAVCFEQEQDRRQSGGRPLVGARPSSAQLT